MNLLVEYIGLVWRAYLQLVGEVVQGDGGHLVQAVVLRQVVLRRPLGHVPVGGRQV